MSFTPVRPKTDAQGIDMSSAPGGEDLRRPEMERGTQGLRRPNRQRCRVGLGRADPNNHPPKCKPSIRHEIILSPARKRLNF